MPCLGLPLQLLGAQPICRRSHVQFCIVGPPEAAGCDPGHGQVQGAQTEACGQREDPGRPSCSRKAPCPSALPPHFHPVFFAPIHTQTGSQRGHRCKQASKQAEGGPGLPAMLTPWHPDSPAEAPHLFADLLHLPLHRPLPHAPPPPPSSLSLPIFIHLYLALAPSPPPSVFTAHPCSCP